MEANVDSLHLSDDLLDTKKVIKKVLATLQAGASESELCYYLQARPRTVRKALRILQDLCEVFTYKESGRQVWVLSQPSKTDGEIPFQKTSLLGSGKVCQHCRSLNNGITRDPTVCMRCEHPL